MIDPANLGRSFGPYAYTVERAEIGQLAAALGDDSPLYRDLAAAQAAGFADLPAPPTLATRYGLWANPTLLAELAALGAPLPRLLHGEQSYAYYAPICAGDRLTARAVIVELEGKRGRGGPFQRLTLETSLTNQRGELALIDRLVVVVRADPAQEAQDAQDALL